MREGEILYLFPHPISEDLSRVERGESPRERLYGFMELRDRGWKVRFSDDRFHSFWAPFLAPLRGHGLRLIDWSTIRKIKAADLVVVKDDFSLMTSLACRLLGTKLVYLDSMFVLPPERWRRWFAALSIQLSDRVVGYSRSQAARWVKELGLREQKVAVLPYALDTHFYRPVPSAVEGDYVLAVGRDLGRDYRTLIEATRASGLKLKLVTLPYLVQDMDLGGHVEVLQHLSYLDLFELYAGAVAAVIPLKDGIDYPSGIRAMLEAMILGTPVIATRNPALVEYVAEGDYVTFVAPEDAAALGSALLEAMRDREHRWLKAKDARTYVLQRYPMDRFIAGLEDILLRVLYAPRSRGGGGGVRNSA